MDPVPVVVLVVVPVEVLVVVPVEVAVPGADREMTRADPVKGPALFVRSM